MSSYLFFGGSFNPVHNWHLTMARMVAEKMGFEAVVFIPCADPPHKNPSDLLPFEHRYNMLLKAIASDFDYPEFHLSDIELRKGQKSYTLETVRALKAEGYPTINWLIGADSLLDLHHWYHASELIKECNLIIVGRPGYQVSWAGMDTEILALERNFVEIANCDISSTQIRKRIANGKSVRHMVPDRVWELIEQNRWYGYHATRGAYVHRPAGA